MLGLTLSGLGIADYLGADDPAHVYAAAALLVVGLTLVAATWLGRARGLLPVGVLLPVAVLVLSALGPQIARPADASGCRATQVGYTTVAELPPGR